MADQASDPSDPANDPTGGITTAGASSAEPAETATAVTGAAGIEPGHDDLLGEFARAMHVAATSQYERMNAELERRRAGQIEASAARASAEVDNVKATSEADIGAIDAWARTETEKIKLERLRRIDARREELAGQLERQDTIKEREVAAIQVAIDAHRSEIDLFFGRMERETDPATIALVASTIPPFPQLAEVAEAARRSAIAEFGGTATAEIATATPGVEATPSATVEPLAEPGDADADATLSAAAPEAVTESRLKAVMDPTASQSGKGEPQRPWEAPAVVSVAAGSGDAAAAPEEAPSRVGSTLLRTVRAIRPVTDRHDRETSEGDTKQ
jgi:hypothetical protein